MDATKHTLNELLVGMFNYILYIEERNLKREGVGLTMSEVHLLESIDKASDNTMTHIANRSMITQGTLTTNVKKLVNKGLVERYRDEKDGRIVRLRVTDQAREILKIHDEFHKNFIDKAVEDLGIKETDVLMHSLSNILDYFRDEYAQKYTE